MNEGWLNNDYLVLFSSEESDERSRKYRIDEYLPGYKLLGLKGWDDFIVLSPDGDTSTVPTVPLIGKYLKPIQLPLSMALEPDPRLMERIKWYITPLVFGGSLESAENMTWLTHEQHVQAVTWWNAKYRELSTQTGEHE